MLRVGRIAKVHKYRLYTLEQRYYSIIPPKPGIAFKAPLPVPTSERLDCSDNRKKLIEDIRTVAQKELYYWKDFHFELPHSVFIDGVKDIPDNKEIFHNPNNRERYLHIPTKGGNKKLSEQQLFQIQKTGTFKTTDTKNQEHTWAVTSLLVTGEQKYKDLQMKSKKLAYKNIHNIPYYLKSTQESFSIPSALKDLQKIPSDLVALIYGAPDMKLPYNDLQQLRKLRTEYMFKEFLPEIKKWKLSQKNRPLNEHPKSIDESAKALQFEANIDGKVEKLDLRFWDSNILTRVQKNLAQIIENTANEWSLDALPYINNTLTQYSLDKPEQFEDIQRKVQEKTNKEVTRRLLSHIQKNQLSLTIAGGAGCAPMLRALVKTNETLSRIEVEWKTKIEKFRSSLREEIIEKHPYNASIKEWMEDEIERAERVAFQIPDNLTVPQFHRLEKYETAIEAVRELCNNTESEKEKGFLRQHLFLASRAYHWIKNEKDSALESFNQEKVPITTIKFQIPILRARDYTIHFDKETGYYSQQTHNTIEVKPDHWGWRKEAFIARNSEIFHTIARFSYKTMFHGPFCYKALLPRPFPAGKELDNWTGQLHPSKKTYPTMISRIKNIWKSVKKSRTEFEQETDLGFLGKGISRAFNVTWNYLIKGALGSTLVLISYPPIVIGSAIFSVALAGLNFFIAPIAAVLKQLTCWFAYDIDLKANSEKPYLPVFSIIAFNGGSFLVRSSVALIISFLISPITAAAIYLGGTSISSLGNAYDRIMFNTIVKPFGRVPQSNSFFARRIAGPGLDRHHVYTIGKSHVLTVLQLELEKEALAEYQSITAKQLLIPQQLYDEFVQQVVSPISQSECYNATIEKSTRLLHLELLSAVQRKSEGFPTLSQVEQILPKVRMPLVELEKTLHEAETLVKDFVQKKIFRDQYQNNEELVHGYWKKNILAEGDWAGLTNLKLSKRFSSDFLLPLADEESIVRLEVQQSAQIMNFLEMICSNDPHDDLEKVSVISEAPKTFPVDEIFNASMHNFPNSYSVPLLSDCFAPFPKPTDIEFQDPQK